MHLELSPTNSIRKNTHITVNLKKKLYFNVNKIKKNTLSYYPLSLTANVSPTGFPKFRRKTSTLFNDNC